VAIGVATEEEEAVEIERAGSVMLVEWVEASSTTGEEVEDEVKEVTTMKGEGVVAVEEIEEEVEVVVKACMAPVTPQSTKIMLMLTQTGAPIMRPEEEVEETSTTIEVVVDKTITTTSKEEKSSTQTSSKIPTM